MNTILNKIGAMRLTPAPFLGFWAILFALMFTLSSCSDDLDVQQSYPFTVEVMPYGDKIKQGETVELRFEIKPEGNYANTLYTIRYFQYDGEGTLKLVDGPVLVNNDRVLLESKTFRLTYTANTSEAVKFGIWIEDNFGSTPWQQTFEFNSKDNGDDDDGGKTPGIIGPVVGPINPIGL